MRGRGLYVIVSCLFIAKNNLVLEIYLCILIFENHNFILVSVTVVCVKKYRSTLEQTLQTLNLKENHNRP